MAQQKVNSMTEWNTAIREWMKKENFIEVFSINHPTETENEVHFIAEGIRCICIKRGTEEYSYLTSDVISNLPKALSIRTTKFAMNDSVKLNSNLLWIMLNVTVLKRHWKKV